MSSLIYSWFLHKVFAILNKYRDAEQGCWQFHRNKHWDLNLSKRRCSSKCPTLSAGNLEGLSVQFSRSAVSDSLWPHESQHARPPCPSPTPITSWHIDGYKGRTQWSNWPFCSSQISLCKPGCTAGKDVMTKSWDSHLNLEKQPQTRKADRRFLKHKMQSF